MKLFVAAVLALGLLGPTAASADTVGVGVHIGGVGVHVGGNAGRHHGWNRHHRIRERYCTSWAWHHHHRTCRRYGWHWTWR